jgi:hypothetical protein
LAAYLGEGGQKGRPGAPRWTLRRLANARMLSIRAPAAEVRFWPVGRIGGWEEGQRESSNPNRTSELPLTLASADRGKGAQREQAANDFPGAQELEQYTAVAGRLAARVSSYWTRPVLTCS